MKLKTWIDPFGPTCCIFVLSLILLLVSVSLPAHGKEPVSEHLEQLLGAGDPVRIPASAEPLHAQAAIKKFYAGRNYSPVWLNASGRILLTELETAIVRISEHGLSPEDYHQRALERATTADDPVAIELLATDAFLTMAAHLIGGRLSPITIETDWTAVRRERDLVKLLEDASASGKLAASLSDLEPNAPGYGVLKHALAMYRKAAAESGWDPIPQGPELKLGRQGPRMVKVRERLRATGFLDVSESVSDHFDGELEAAVAMFQRRNRPPGQAAGISQRRHSGNPSRIRGAGSFRKKHRS